MGILNGGDSSIAQSVVRISESEIYTTAPQSEDLFSVKKSKWV